MIYLKKGQTLADNPGMVVYDPTGYYNDGDSIICAPVFAPEEPACRYEAQYIAYGGLIYSVSNPDELMEQILKIDPKSLFGKDSSAVALDKMVQDIVPQKSEDITTENLDETATSTPSFDFENQNNSNDVASTTATNISTTTPSTQTSTSTLESATPTPTPTPTPTLTPISTPTPTPTPVIDVASSTIPVDVSTTTPPIQVPADVSTSTPVVTESPSPTPSPTPTPSPEPSATPSPLETPSEPIATSTEVVAFAKNLVKRKISKRLGL